MNRILITFIILITNSYSYAQTSMIELILELNHGINSTELILPDRYEIISETVFMTSHLGYEPDTSLVLDDDSIDVYLASTKTVEFLNDTTTREITTSYSPTNDNHNIDTVMYTFNRKNKISSTISKGNIVKFNYDTNGFLASAKLTSEDKTYEIIQSIKTSAYTEYIFNPQNIVGSIFGTSRLYLLIESGEVTYSSDTSKNENSVVVDLYSNKIVSMDNCYLEYDGSLLVKKMCPNTFNSTEYDYGTKNDITSWKNHMNKVQYLYLDRNNYYEKVYAFDALYQINKIRIERKKNERINQYGENQVKKYPILKFISEANHALVDDYGLNIDFGRIKPDQKVQQTIRIFNDGESPLKIYRIESSCRCLRHEVLNNTDELNPGDFLSIKLEYDSRGKLRDDMQYRIENKRLTLFTNSKLAKHYVWLKGRIER